MQALETTTDAETGWMTPQEKWAWEKIKAGEKADLSRLPQEIRDVVGDGSKPPVQVPLTQDKGGPPTPVPDDAWPVWQVLTGRFIEQMLCAKDIIAQRSRNRVWIESARIVGDVFLDQESCPGDVNIVFCRVDVAPELRGTVIGGTLGLQGSHFANGLRADRLRTGGAVFFRSGALCEGEVRLVGAHIGGQLTCTGSYFIARANESSLCADGIETGGDVFLSDGSRFDGEVRLLGAVIGGALVCNGSKFTGRENEYALCAELMKTRESVFFREGAQCDGIIGLSGAEVGGSLQLTGGVLNGPLDLSRTVILGDLRLDETLASMPPPEWGKAAEINLQNAKVGALQGSLQAWRREGAFVPMQLDGMKPGHLAGGMGGDSLDMASAKEIVAWIAAGTRTPEHRKRGFAQSPYMTIANLLEAGGRSENAREVRIALERRMTKEMGWGPRKFFRKLLSAVNAYGYRPYRGLMWTALFTIVFALTGYAWAHGGAWPAYAAFMSSQGLDLIPWLGFSFEQIVPFIEMDPVSDNFLQNQFGIPTNDNGFADPKRLPAGLRAMFMIERVIGITILSMSVAGIAAWAERRS